MKKTIVALTSISMLAFAGVAWSAEIAATGDGNWSSTVPNAPWAGGVVPGTNDSVLIDVHSVTLDTNATITFVYGTGSLTIGPAKTLTIAGDNLGAQGAQGLATLNASAEGCTVIYMGNVFWAKRTDYFNLSFKNDSTNAYDFFNGPIPGSGAVPMNVGGNMTITGKVKVQQGADIMVGGSLLIGTNSSWDASSFNLTVASNTTVGGLFLDLDGALGQVTVNGNITVTAGSVGWNISDVVHWSLMGSLTNNGLIVGKGYGSISFDGAGIITGSRSILIPTMTVNGAYLIANTITLTTNTPTLNGTIQFDIARTNKIVLTNSVLTGIYYSGYLDVTNSGGAPVSGASYKLFDALSYNGAFTSTSFPSLPNGLSWVDNTLTTGSIDVIGTSTGSPTISFSRNGNNLVLSWDSATFPGYSVQGQTNSAGIGTSWGATSSGTVSPFTTPINPANKAVFFRLVHP